MGRSSGMVAAGRLSQRDVDILGMGLHRLYPVRKAEGFDDLLTAIDQADGAAAGGDGAGPAIAMDGRRARA
jgi:hypothetical protein